MLERQLAASAAHLLAERDTPWTHKGRDINKGLDCIGLVVCCMEVGGHVWHNRELLLGLDYGMHPFGRRLEGALEAEGRSVERGCVRLADVVAFSWRRDGMAHHLGLISRLEERAGDTPILYVAHAWRPAGKVIEHRLDYRWAGNVVGYYTVD